MIQKYDKRNKDILIWIDGKLYHTNHPNEVNSSLASGFGSLEEVQDIDYHLNNYPEVLILV